MTIRNHPLSGSKYTILRISVVDAKRTNGKCTIGYPMDVLWTMCASRESAFGFKQSKLSETKNTLFIANFFLFLLSLAGIKNIEK
jgi:hypothetical protein